MGEWKGNMGFSLHAVLRTYMIMAKLELEWKLTLYTQKSTQTRTYMIMAKLELEWKLTLYTQGSTQHSKSQHSTRRNLIEIDRSRLT